MELAKRNSRRTKDYLSSLREIVELFGKGREQMPIDKFNVREVEVFLDLKELKSRSTLRSRLSTLFKFTIRRGYRVDSPCDRLESLTVAHAPVPILTLKEVEECLDWFKAYPRSMAWFVLSTFAGLRPEEAVKTFLPYDQTKEVNEEARKAIATLIKLALATTSGNLVKAPIFINNRLEGNALNTIAEVLASDDWR